MPLTRIPITENWWFKQETSLHNHTAKEFLPVAQFPTVAHIDLLHHRLIPDPYIDTNELDCLWVNDADWTYQTTLPDISLPQSTSRASLLFDGLDTIVTVFFNGEKILESNNMHVSHRIDITSLLKSSETPNVLELKFKNAPEFAKNEMKRIGYKGPPNTISFGGPERLFVRKAQYHWGWDWGPALNTSGPWKEVWVETWEEDTGRIEEFIVRQEVSEDLQNAVVKITGVVDGKAEKVVLQLEGPGGKEVLSQEVSVENGVFKANLKVENPELWYPFTYGGQPLYTIKASIPNQHQQTRKIGFRRLRLLQHPLKEQEGTSFLFEVNNIRTFLGGSCWIPGDYLLPRMTAKRYHDWLSLAKSGNQASEFLCSQNIGAQSNINNSDPCMGWWSRRISRFLLFLRRTRNPGVARFSLCLWQLSSISRFCSQRQKRSRTASKASRSSRLSCHLGWKQRRLHAC